LAAIVPICRSAQSARFCASGHFATIRTQSRACQGVSRHSDRPLSASEIRQLLERHWTPPGVKLPGDAIDSAAAASIIRITGGNFRLLNRLLTQVERILEITPCRQ
jgi:hypothetical protein